TKGHPDQLGDLFSALSSLDQIPDLLDSLRRKLCLPPTSQYMGGKFSRHCLALCAFVLPPLHPRLFPLLWPRRLTKGIDRGYPLLAPVLLRGPPSSGRSRSCRLLRV